MNQDNQIEDLQGDYQEAPTATVAIAPVETLLQQATKKKEPIPSVQRLELVQETPDYANAVYTYRTTPQYQVRIKTYECKVPAQETVALTGADGCGQLQSANSNEQGQDDGGDYR